MLRIILFIVGFFSSERPGAPTNAPEITALGPKFVELSWQPPEHDGGSPIIGYMLERLDVGGRTWMPINKAPIADTKYRINNLYEEIPYRMRVKAVNDEGVSEPSPETEQFYCREQKGTHKTCKKQNSFTVENKKIHMKHVKNRTVLL